MCKELLHSSNKKIDNSQKMLKECDPTLHSRKHIGSKWAFEKCDVKIKIKMRCYTIYWVEWLKLKRLITQSIGENMEQMGFPYIAM